MNLNLSAAVNSLKVQATAKPKLDELKKATESIEAMFVKDLLKTMRKSVAKVSWGDGGGKEIYQDMLDDVLAQNIGKAGTLGISKMMYKQLSPKILNQVMAQLKAEGNEAIDIKL